MKRKIKFLILTLLFTIHCYTTAMAHPEVIEKKFIDLKTETIIIQEKGKANASPSENTYNITHITADGTNGIAAYNMYSRFNSKMLATSAVLKVDISEVESVSDFNLKFTFSTGTCAGNSLQVHYVTYKNGEDLMNTLSSQSNVTSATMPQAIVTSSSRLIYEYQNTEGIDKEIVGELSAKDASEENPKKYASLLEEHLSTAITKGEKALYLIISCETPTALEDNTKAYFKVYTSLSTDKAPSFSVGAAPITSEIFETEKGYKYKVNNLNAYTENAMIIVAVYNSKDEFVMAATTKTGEDIVNIVCDDVSSIRAYIWEAWTLKPITYVEKIDL